MKTIIRFACCLSLALTTFAMEHGDPNASFSIAIAIDFIGHPNQAILGNLFVSGKEHGLLRLCVNAPNQKNTKPSLVIKLVKNNDSPFTLYAYPETNNSDGEQGFSTEALMPNPGNKTTMLFFRITDNVKQIFMGATSLNYLEKVQHKGTGLTLFQVYCRTSKDDTEQYIGKIVGISDFINTYFADYFFKY